MQKIKHPQLIILKTSAEQITTEINKLGYTKANHIISSLPLTIIPKEVSHTILQESFHALDIDGLFIQYQYSLTYYKKLKHVFGKNIKEIEVGFLKDQRSWIFFPTEVEIFVSKDGKKYSSLGIKKIDAKEKSEEVKLQRLGFAELRTSGRYVKVMAKKLGVLPIWHLGYEHDGRSWLFADEIEIK